MRYLDGIWEWNAERYGDDHAEGYVSFLRSEAYMLDREYADGKPVPGAPEVLYRTIRKSRRKQSHGHVVIFQVIGKTVEVLRFYHTSQDWENRFREGR